MVLISAIQQSDSVIHIYTGFFLSHHFLLINLAALGL